MTPKSITQSNIYALLDAAQIEEHTFHGTEFLISYRLPSGFTVTGRAVCLDETTFDLEEGRKIARDNAAQELWQLESYRICVNFARDPSEFSDGFHTMGELYDHRCLLFAALIRSQIEQQRARAESPLVIPN